VTAQPPSSGTGGSTQNPSSEQSVGATHSETEAHVVRQLPDCSQVYGAQSMRVVPFVTV